MNWKKTKEGRIVYDRKPHIFRLRDAVRICKKINLRVWAIPGELWLEAVNNILKLILDEEYVSNLDLQLDFSGKTIAVKSVSGAVDEIPVEFAGGILLYNSSFEGGPNA